jgi:hypothetical protein
MGKAIIGQEAPIISYDELQFGSTQQSIVRTREYIMMGLKWAKVSF